MAETSLKADIDRTKSGLIAARLLTQQYQLAPLNMPIDQKEIERVGRLWDIEREENPTTFTQALGGSKAFVLRRIEKIYHLPNNYSNAAIQHL